MRDYKDVLVKKPWGYEYLMYRNKDIGLWCLHIKYGEQTSLHCHPLKKTGLILLTGKAEIRFLNSALTLKAPARLMLRAGLFHSTAAISRNGAVVIEIETPPHKRNLIRLEDEYDRKGKPYENVNAMIPLSKDYVKLGNLGKDKKRKYNIAGRGLILENIKDLSVLKRRPDKEIVIILRGALRSRLRENVLGPGDVVTLSTVKRLMKTFRATQNILLLTIR